MRRPAGKQRREETSYGIRPQHRQCGYNSVCKRDTVVPRAELPAFAQGVKVMRFQACFAAVPADGSLRQHHSRRYRRLRDGTQTLRQPSADILCA
jgi:hypothetical protein